MESVHSKSVPFGVTTYQISRTPNGEPQTHTNFGFQKFTSAIPSDVEKSTEFNGMITFQIRIKTENCICGMVISNWLSSSIQPF